MTLNDSLSALKSGLICCHYIVANNPSYQMCDFCGLQMIDFNNTAWIRPYIYGGVM